MRRADVRGPDDAVEPRAVGLRDVAVRLPVQRRGMVRRAKLLARLDRAPAASLILLVAPGGYGKTTLLASGSRSPPPSVPG